MGIAGYDNDNSINRDNEADDDLLSVKEVLGPISHRENSIGGGQLSTQAETVSVPNSQGRIMVQVTAKALEVCVLALHR